RSVTGGLPVTTDAWDTPFDFKLRVCLHTNYENTNTGNKYSDGIYIDCAGKGASRVSFIQTFSRELTIHRAGQTIEEEAVYHAPEKHREGFEPNGTKRKLLKTGVWHLDAHRSDEDKVGFVESGWIGGIGGDDAWMYDPPGIADFVKRCWNDGPRDGQKGF